LERKEEGYFVSDEEVVKAAKIAGIAGAGMVVFTLLRQIFWPPIIRIRNDG